MINDLDRRILAACTEADLGLLSIVALIRESFPNDDPAAIKRRALAVLEPLVRAGLVRAGRPTPDGKAFVAWNLLPEASCARIQKDWATLGRELRHGDIAWFSSTKAGAKAAAKR